MQLIKTLPFTINPCFRSSKENAILCLIDKLYVALSQISSFIYVLHSFLAAENFYIIHSTVIPISLLIFYSCLDSTNFKLSRTVPLKSMSIFEIVTFTFIPSDSSAIEFYTGCCCIIGTTLKKMRCTVISQYTANY